MGANWNVVGGGGAVGIEMPKFEAKKEDFAKIWQKLGGAEAGGGGGGRLHRPWCFVHGVRRSQSVAANVSNISFERSKTGSM